MAQWSEEEAKRHITRAEADKSASDEIYREAVELTFPDRENWTRTKEGTDKSAYSWDSTPQVSVIRAANRLSSDFTPQFMPWCEVGLGPAAEKMPDAAFEQATGRNKQTAKGDLENITAVVQAIFNGPGFPTASNEMYIDWHYGQGGMRIMPNDDDLDAPVTFAAMPLSHFYAYEGPNGKLDRWFFWHTMRPDAVEQEWPDAKIPEALEEMKKSTRKQEAKLCSVVYRDYGELNKSYRYEVFLMNKSGCTRIVERQSRTPPFVTPRYSKLPGENRGRGPVLFALPDIRTTNKIVEMTLRAAALAVGGVYTATENGVDGPVRIKPLAVMKVRTNGGPNGPSLQRLDTPARIDFGEVLLDKLHENIKKVIGDNSLPPEAGPIRTATEFIQRARELVSDQAGGLGRLYAEFVIPAVQRVVDILESKKLISTEGLKIDQFLIEVRMISPLAKGEQMAEVENIVRFVEMLRMMGGQAGEQLVALEVDIPAATGRLGDLMNVPQDVRNGPAKKTQIQQAAARGGVQEAGGSPEQAEQAAAEVERIEARPAA
jgi:hypothetical protein